jgi:hypothetical protein
MVTLSWPRFCMNALVTRWTNFVQAAILAPAAVSGELTRRLGEAAHRRLCDLSILDTVDSGQAMLCNAARLDSSRLVNGKQ